MSQETPDYLQVARIPHILVVDDDEGARLSLVRILESADYFCETATNGEEALDMIEEHDYDLVLSDLRMPKMDGIALLTAMASQDNMPAIIVVTAHGEMKLAIEATRLGAYDFLIKPIDRQHLLLAAARALEHQRLLFLNRRLSRQLAHPPTFEHLVGKSPVMLELFRDIAQIAPSEAIILITGESGTGKEQIAKAIHNRSKRKDSRFNVVDCSAIPENLVESVLFGHKRGAFTGANRDQAGLLGYSDGGTVFFDEIGELPIHLQAKLLRVIQERSFIPVGSQEPVSVDIRILAATNRDLKEEIKAGNFREDLYYRLNVVPIHLPPLRERREDIAALAYHFLDEFSETKTHITGISPEAMGSLENYKWPGNVRELRNAIERAVSLSTSDQIEREDLPEPIRKEAPTPVENSSIQNESKLETYEKFRQKSDRDYLSRLMMHVGGNVSKGAELAGVSRKVMYKLLNECELDPQSFRGD
ncbi:MAG: sigma-54-dependent transcriptional regulator [Candidatus Sumerlaeia bacterium]